MELDAETEKLLSIELMEFNPVLDVSERTAQFAIWLLQSAVGKKIL